MADFTIKRGSYCPVCRGTTLQDCAHTMDELRNTVSGGSSLAARMAEAVRVLDTIDEEGDDHYYSIADRARMILRGIVTMSEQNKARVNLAESRCWNWPCGLPREHSGPCQTYSTDDDLEDERDDSPYCECGVVEHGEEEQAFNRCSCCGKRVE